MQYNRTDELTDGTVISVPYARISKQDLMERYKSDKKIRELLMFDGTAEKAIISDHNKDGIPVIIFYRNSLADSLEGIYLITDDGKPRLDTTPTPWNNTGAGSGLDYYELKDVWGNEDLELIIHSFSVYDNGPYFLQKSITVVDFNTNQIIFNNPQRGTYLYDPTGEKIFSDKDPYFNQDFVFADLDGKGRKELVVKWETAENFSPLEMEPPVHTSVSRFNYYQPFGQTSSHIIVFSPDRDFEEDSELSKAVNEAYNKVLETADSGMEPGEKESQIKEIFDSANPNISKFVSDYLSGFIDEYVYGISPETILENFDGLAPCRVKGSNKCTNENINVIKGDIGIESGAFQIYNNGELRIEKKSRGNEIRIEITPQFSINEKGTSLEVNIIPHVIYEPIHYGGIRYLDSWYFTNKDMLRIGVEKGLHYMELGNYYWDSFHGDRTSTILRSFNIGETYEIVLRDVNGFYQAKIFPKGEEEPDWQISAVRPMKSQRPIGGNIGIYASGKDLNLSIDNITVSFNRNLTKEDRKELEELTKRAMQEILINEEDAGYKTEALQTMTSYLPKDMALPVVEKALSTIFYIDPETMTVRPFKWLLDEYQRIKSEEGFGTDDINPAIGAVVDIAKFKYGISLDSDLDTYLKEVLTDSVFALERFARLEEPEGNKTDSNGRSYRRDERLGIWLYTTPDEIDEINQHHRETEDELEYMERVGKEMKKAVERVFGK